MFKKQNRVSNAEFEYFFKTGKRSHSPSFTLIHLPHEQLKVAVVVPKKVIKTAVGRNHLRRQMYHTLRPLLEASRGVYIILVKKTIDRAFSDATRQELIDLVGKTK